MLDIDASKDGKTLNVQVQIDASGRRIWVNIDGVCEVRISRIKSLTLTDDRPHPLELTVRKDFNDYERETEKREEDSQD